MKILRKEVEDCLMGCGGFFDAFDDMFKAAFNITDEEYDFICLNATDDELYVLTGTLGDIVSFSRRRKMLEVRNKYLEMYNSKNE